MLAAGSLKWGEGEFTAQQEPVRNFITKPSLPFLSYILGDLVLEFHI